jgi:hypothetical protein
MLYVYAIHIRCTHVYSLNSSLIDKKKNCQCQNSGIRQFWLLYICLSKQQHITLSALIYSCRLPISSLFLCKKEETHTIYILSNTTTGLPPSRIMCIYLVRPTLLKQESLCKKVTVFKHLKPSYLSLDFSRFLRCR